MNPLLRFLAALLVLLILAGAFLYHKGGQQQEFKADITIRDTTVANVMEHLSKPELISQWAIGVDELKADEADSNFASLTVSDEHGSVKMENQFLCASDRSITTLTRGEHSEAFSVWQVLPAETGSGDIVVRQLKLGTHRGWGRLEAIFRRSDQIETMQADLKMLKSFIEQGKMASATTDDGKDESGALPKSSQINQ